MILLAFGKVRPTNRKWKNRQLAKIKNLANFICFHLMFIICFLSLMIIPSGWIIYISTETHLGNEREDYWLLTTNKIKGPPNLPFQIGKNCHTPTRLNLSLEWNSNWSNDHPHKTYDSKKSTFLHGAKSVFLILQVWIPQY